MKRIKNLIIFMKANIIKIIIDVITIIGIIFMIKIFYNKYKKIINGIMILIAFILYSFLTVWLFDNLGERLEIFNAMSAWILGIITVGLGIAVILQTTMYAEDSKKTEIMHLIRESNLELRRLYEKYTTQSELLKHYEVLLKTSRGPLELNISSRANQAVVVFTIRDLINNVIYADEKHSLITKLIEEYNLIKENNNEKAINEWGNIKNAVVRLFLNYISNSENFVRKMRAKKSKEIEKIINENVDKNEKLKEIAKDFY